MSRVERSYKAVSQPEGSIVELLGPPVQRDERRKQVSEIKKKVR